MVYDLGSFPWGLSDRGFILNAIEAEVGDYMMLQIQWNTLFKKDGMTNIT